MVDYLLNEIEISIDKIPNDEKGVNTRNGI
jgi:hypothetical protein